MGESCHLMKDLVCLLLFGGGGGGWKINRHPIQSQRLPCITLVVGIHNGDSNLEQMMGHNKVLSYSLSLSLFYICKCNYLYLCSTPAYTQSVQALLNLSESLQFLQQFYF